MIPSIVIDTNVMVAALKSRLGASFKLLMALPSASYNPCLSVPLFVEYESILKRPELLPHLSTDDIDSVLNYVLSRASIHEIFFLWRPFLKDPKDDLVLEAAVASQSQYLVTFNLRDFADVEKQFGIKVVTPQEFLHEQRLI
uniref:putative toxin-antitoxin system toxin component, PIN family n=1 Tax=Cellvibrio fontiphilus TaxID=1815559 RepID=UPI002B4BD24D|nr:putative toxin-antitoxin system toxin component, PIN family [Cellvibrio fontiphilus]